ncbi:MAG: hypothetical protein ACREBC_28240 [Pyrinomonadaceae bacterium]
MAGTHRGAVLIKGNVAHPHPMQAVLDRPVTAVEGEQTLGIGPFLDEAGDEVDRFGGGLTLVHGQALAGDARDLSDIGEVEIVVEAGGGLQGAGSTRP